MFNDHYHAIYFVNHLHSHIRKQASIFFERGNSPQGRQHICGAPQTRAQSAKKQSLQLMVKTT